MYPLSLTPPYFSFKKLWVKPILFFKISVIEFLYEFLHEGDRLYSDCSSWYNYEEIIIYHLLGSTILFCLSYKVFS